jgi:DNA modification methylase
VLEVSTAQREASRLSKEEWREYTKTVWHIANVSHPDHPAVFPLEVPMRLVKLFSFAGETILDPFAGTGTTGSAAVLAGRRAVCVDQSADYVKIMRTWQTSLNGKGESVEVIRGDARDLRPHLKDDSVGLAITSPPYWNKANYGSGRANLGTIPSYPAFIRALRPAFEEVYRVLAPGRKFGVVTANVNQHTDHGLLTFPLATDIVVLLRDIGFVLVNEVIWSKDGTGGRWGSANHQRPIFGSYPFPPNFLFKNVHEYVIIVAKPSGIAAKGRTVLPYAELMELASDMR